ncbi:SH3 domain-containing protein [Bacillus songklensis]|uniref:SH3 domain-containing protein n=1 Tax=Bacillus songklensis TaxID=1069116 RepID=A0ABV8B5S7_9BACI
MNRRIVLIVSLFLAIWLPLSSVGVASAASLPKVTVNASSLIVREYPSPKAKSIGQVNRGQVLYIHSTQPGGWAEIRYNNQKGYVPAGYLKSVAQPAAAASSSVQKATVNVSTLLVREYASPKARVVGSLKKGNVTYIHATKPGGWAEIRYNNKKAYVPAGSLKVVPKSTAAAPTFKSGQYLVGKQIQPGIYFSSGGVTYWERQSGLSGSLDDIIANSIPSGQEYVEIKSSDRGFKFEGGSFTKFDPRNHNHTIKSAFGDGTYLVGVDIVPGTYKGTGDGYWERSSSVSGDMDDIIVNEIPSGTFYVEIEEGDFAFKTSGIKWTLVK